MLHLASLATPGLCLLAVICGDWAPVLALIRTSYAVGPDWHAHRMMYRSNPAGFWNPLSAVHQSNGIHDLDLLCTHPAVALYTYVLWLSVLDEYCYVLHSVLIRDMTEVIDRAHVKT